MTDPEYHSFEAPQPLGGPPWPSRLLSHALYGLSILSCDILQVCFLPPDGISLFFNSVLWRLGQGLGTQLTVATRKLRCM